MVKDARATDGGQRLRESIRISGVRKNWRADWCGFSWLPMIEVIGSHKPGERSPVPHWAGATRCWGVTAHWPCVVMLPDWGPPGVWSLIFGSGLRSGRDGARGMRWSTPPG